MPRPEIVVLAADPASPIVRAAVAGCEEEGVPYGVRVGEGRASELARAAAACSDFFIGVGVDGEGAVAIYDHRVSERGVLLVCPAADAALARGMGSNAARLVKGLPLRTAAGGMLPSREEFEESEEGSKSSA